MPPDLAPDLALELTLAEADLPLLLKDKALAGGRARGAVPCRVVWHDTPNGALAMKGLCLAQSLDEAGGMWRLENLVPAPGEICPPGMPPRTIEQRPAPWPDLPEPLLPVAAFEGRSRLLSRPGAGITVVLLQGELRAVAATRPICRLTLTGPGAGQMALGWAAIMRLLAPSASLAAEALTLAGRSAAPRPLGAPTLSPSHTVGDGFACVVAHLAGVILHHAPAAADRIRPEPVHQMRVALRRLRSAMTLFRRAVACPHLADVALRLKPLGAVLGPSRDWDVFLAGTGQAVMTAFSGDDAVAGLIAAAERQREAAYDALVRYLDGPQWRQLGIALAELVLLRPWQDAPQEDPEVAARQAELQEAGLAGFAAKALSRRLDAVLEPGADLSDLSIEALHAIRLHGKRLRYAAEFFAPLFAGKDTRRFLRRMTRLQERLGHLNDTAVAATLMAGLPARGHDRRYAIGVVRGFVAAGTSFSRQGIERSWRRFRKTDPFWE